MVSVLGRCRSLTASSGSSLSETENPTDSSPQSRHIMSTSGDLSCSSNSALALTKLMFVDQQIPQRQGGTGSRSELTM